MRQSDILLGIGKIILPASLEASPENYEICHRFITRSDADVCEQFEAALAAGTPINADAFQKIKDGAAPPRGQIDVSRHMENFDDQIAAMIGAATMAAGHAKSYTNTLTKGAQDLGAIDLTAEAKAVIANLIAQTHSMAERTTALESSLAHASTELSSLRHELERAHIESATDALTSLPNRRSFDFRLAEAVAAAAASQEPLSLAFCDVDHFKQFNDTWGHGLGDEVLRFIGVQMTRHFGDCGVPARFGGEEFVVLLPKHDSAMAMKRVERFCDVLRARVLKVRTDGREIGKVTLSVGVATLGPHDTDKTLVERADQAMYAAKNAGRNRIVCAKALATAA